MKPGLRQAAVIAWMLVCVTHATAQTAWDAGGEGLKGRELVMRPTFEAHRKMYLPLASGGAEAFVLCRGDRLFPLRGSERVTVMDVKRKRDHIELKVRSSRLGEGRLDFYGAPADADMFESWLDEVFEVRTPEAEFHRYVGNRQSRVLHLRGANHLPVPSDRELFLRPDNATANGYRRCGVCFLPHPDVTGYDTERVLATMSLQQVRSAYYPLTDDARQRHIADVGAKVLDHWPVPLKGYRYRFQILDSDDVNALAVPTGYIFVTRGLLESIETDEELAAVLAHEITHVENRHTYREWRKASTVGAIVGILGAVAGAKSEEVKDIVSQMAAFSARLFLSGFGRDREREADSFASLYVNTVGASSQPFESVLRKLKYTQDVFDPFGNAVQGPFATHPHIDERLSKARDTVTRAFRAGKSFRGLTAQGETVAVLTLEIQRLYGRELEVIATLSTTAELGKKDNVNTLTLELSNKRLELKERTAESVYPGDEVSALFRTDKATGLIEEPVTGVRLKLRNVVRWEPADRE